MSSIKVVTLIMLPLATFICVFVVMWWCLFVRKNTSSRASKDASTSSGRLRIAKTASKEESEARSRSIEMMEDPSVLTEDPVWRNQREGGPLWKPPTEESAPPPPAAMKNSGKSPVRAMKTLISTRFSSERRVQDTTAAALGEEIADYEYDLNDIENSGNDNINDEELTLDDDPIILRASPIARPSPSKSIMKFLPTLSVRAAQETSVRAAQETSPPTEIYSPRVDMSDMESHPDDETEGGLGYQRAVIEDRDNRTLASKDIYM